MFQTKPRNILSIYFTAGFPQLNDTQLLLETIQQAGADFVEIGMPFCDPIVDGPVIQAANQKALANGMSMHVLFDQLEAARRSISLPIILMGYLNPVLKYGVENFCKRAKKVGIDGVILPDLPLLLYEKEYKRFFVQSGLPIMFLVTPRTPLERLARLDEESGGFLYLVGRQATTGHQNGQISSPTSPSSASLLAHHNIQLKNPLLMGFGIRNAADLAQAWRQAPAAVIGSAFLDALTHDLKTSVSTFIQNLR